MQIVPACHQETKAQNPLLASIERPRWNIAAGVFCDRQPPCQWNARRDMRTAERIGIAFGSYVAGDGDALNAYRRANAKYGDVREWWRIAAYAAPHPTHSGADGGRRLSDRARPLPPATDRRQVEADHGSGRGCGGGGCCQYGVR